MTIGIRDTRKIDAAYNMTEQDVRGQARFDDSIGIYPEFIDGYGVLDPADDRPLLPAPYRNLVPKGMRNLLVAGRSIGRRSDRPRLDAQHVVLCRHRVKVPGWRQRSRCTRHRSSTRVDTGLVQAELDRQGVRYR